MFSRRVWRVNDLNANKIGEGKNRLKDLILSLLHPWREYGQQLRSGSRRVKFNYETYKLTDGSEYEVKNMKNGRIFGMPESSTSDYIGDTVGIVTLEGTAMVIAWNKKCSELKPVVYEWGKDTNETTGCVAIAMDVNNNSSPNLFNKDFILFNGLQLFWHCGMKIRIFI